MNLCSIKRLLGITMIFLMPMQLINASAIQITDDFGCSLMKCSELLICPKDSSMESAYDEGSNYEDIVPEEDYEVEGNNRFAGAPIEAFGPIQHSTEKTATILTATSTKSGNSIDATAAPPQLFFPSEVEDEKEKYVVEETKRRKRELNTSTKEIASHEDETLKQCCGEYKCVCRPCPAVPECDFNQVAIEVLKGLGIPGQCCSTYECVKKTQCAADTDDGKFQWIVDSCTKCRCVAGLELCENLCQNDVPSDEYRSCYSEYWKVPMLDGSKWLENNDCSECSCVNGKRRCFTNVCAAAECKNPIKVKGKCCPQCVDSAEKEKEDEEEEQTVALEWETEVKSLKNSTIAADDDNEATRTSAATETVANTSPTLSIEMKSSTEVVQENSSDENVLLDFTGEATSVSSLDADVSSTIKYGSSSSITESSSLSLEDSSTASPSSMESFTLILNDSATKSHTSTTTLRTSSATSSATNLETFTTTAFNKNSSIFTSNLDSFSSSTTDSSSASTSSSTAALILTTNSSTSTSKFTEPSDTPLGSQFPNRYSTTTPQTQFTKDATSIPSQKSTTPLNASTSVMPISLLTSLLPEADEEEDNNYTEDSSKLSPQTSSPSASAVPTISTEAITSNIATTTTATTETISSSTFSTSAPAPLEPQPTNYQPDSESLPLHYRDNFPVYMAVAVVVSLTICFGLGIFFIQKSCTKSRTSLDLRKFYSTIPSSETSLSHTSTNTALTA